MSPLVDGSMCLSLRATRSASVIDDDRPLILVVCDDAERLSATRQALRQLGLLPAAARSVDAALSLLRQIQMDACLLCQTVTEEQAQTLWWAMEAIRPGCPRLYMQEHQAQALVGWRPCSQETLAEAVAANMQTLAT